MSTGASEFKAGRDEEYCKSFTAKIEDPEKLPNFLYGQFPKGFLLGAATAAFQVEGGWNADGKGESIWDHVVRTMPEKIDDRSSGNEGCDSYSRYLDDVQVLKDLGANVYRFSISWSRILPNGDASEINQAGVDYYNRLIDALLENGIVPIATIYHWDMPQAIAEKFNWLSEELVILFTDFARVCFASFGDRVKHWITINEPWIHAVISYDLGVHPPFIHDAAAIYKVVHNLLKAHAAAYRMYEAEFKAIQRGKVGISLDSWGLEPADPTSEEDLAATERAWQFKLGCVAHPIVYGEYPPLMREIVDQKSKNEGLTVSRLPDFDDEWKVKVKGSFDFIGFNHYSCEKVTTPGRAPNDVTRIVFSANPEVGYDADQDNFRFHDSDWPTAQSWWLKFTPWAIRGVLNFFKERYGNPEIIITENGWSDGREVMEDYDRLYFYKAYLNEVLKAINIDGCNVTGYCAWTLLDSWEWTAGHTVSFGLHYIDLDDPLRKRIPRASAKYLAEVYRNKGFPEPTAINK